jgi:hypothetical protein
MQVHCPVCRNPVETPDITSSGEVLCPTCGSRFRPESDQTGSYAAERRQVGKFELLHHVGAGAFGAVWKAQDKELGRVVAVKLPHAGRVVTPRDHERFLREGRSAAQLRHPGIVSMHDVGHHEGLPFLVCDFIDGVTLADLLTARRLEVREAADLVAQVADALDYAHSLGVVHRDIKPSNIMLERPAPGTGGVGARPALGRPLLMDFGLALRDDAEVTMTQDGQIPGATALAAGRLILTEKTMFPRIVTTSLVVLGMAVSGFLAAAPDEKPKTGTVIGEVKSRKDTPDGKNTFIEVLAPGEEKPRRYHVLYDPKAKEPIKSVLAAVRAAKVGDRVELDWVQTGHGPAIKAFRVLKKEAGSPKNEHVPSDRQGAAAQRSTACPARPFGAALRQAAISACRTDASVAASRQTRVQPRRPQAPLTG